MDQGSPLSSLPQSGSRRSSNNPFRRADSDAGSHRDSPARTQNSNNPFDRDDRSERSQRDRDRFESAPVTPVRDHNNRQLISPFRPINRNHTPQFNPQHNPPPVSLVTDTDFTDIPHAADDGDSHDNEDWSAPLSRAMFSHAQSLASWIFDTGANVHLTPFRDDFSSFNSIVPRPVYGMKGHSIAKGTGTVHFETPDGLMLSLEHVLYVPDASVRICSTQRLCDTHGYDVIFNKKTFRITEPTINDNVAAKVLSSGVRDPSSSLFVLKGSKVIPSSSPPTTLSLTQRIPDISCWHRRLGHPSLDKVIAMARKGVVSGMTVDLSVLPPKCDSCILGKQTHSSVPKSRQHPRPTCRLAKVCVDVCGPFPRSRSGNHYTLDIVERARRSP